jgi:hydrogenase maturation protease
MSEPQAQAVVIGIGNVVRTDDGLGVHAIRRLRERRKCAEDVELIEGGTAGLLLLPHIADAHRVLIIDAINIGARAGTLVRLARGEGAFASGMTPHDVGLADLLDAARLTAAWPEELVLHGAQPRSTAFGTELTPPVAAALDGLVDAIEAELTLWRSQVAVSP